MKKTLIFGHKNPDTDSICSALAYADFKKQLGVDQVEAVSLGVISNETQYALDHFKVEAPRIIKAVDPLTEDVILVDHNEFQQSVDNIRDVKIIEVIDHHRVANFETSDPLYFRAEPVGCTATIIHKMYKEEGLTIPKQIAGLLLSAIISDLLLLKSPTCTQEDIDAAHELAELADVDMDTYGLEMLKAGTDLSGKSIAELLTLDSKEFVMGDKNVEIAQINAVDLDEIYLQQAELEVEIAKVIEAKDLELFLLVVTDIINSNSSILAMGEAAKNVETAFLIELINNRALLEGVVSRKKQIVGKLTDTFLI